MRYGGCKIGVEAIVGTTGSRRRDSAENDGDTARTYIPYSASKMFRRLSQQLSATYISATPSVLASDYIAYTRRKHGFTSGMYAPPRLSMVTCSWLAGKHLRYRAGSRELLVLLQSEWTRCFFSMSSPS